MPQRKLTFPYFPMPVKDQKTGKVIGAVYRPLVPIQLGHKDRFTLPFRALVDSGSDRNLFPAATGISAGLNIRKGKSGFIEGIGGHKIKIYTLQVKLALLTPKARTFTAEVDFSYEHQVPLLGRSGFFGFFKRVEFREKRRVLEITL